MLIDVHNQVNRIKWNRKLERQLFNCSANAYSKLAGGAEGLASVYLGSKFMCAKNEKLQVILPIQNAKCGFRAENSFDERENKDTGPQTMKTPGCDRQSKRKHEIDVFGPPVKKTSNKPSDVLELPNLHIDETPLQTLCT
jgi:hypothetical protein